MTQAVSNALFGFIARGQGFYALFRSPFRSLARWRRRHRRCPTVLQMEGAECGAASLCMILAFYGRWVPLDEMRRECAVSRDGTSFRRLALAAKAYGLRPRSLSVDPRGLAQLHLPAIAFCDAEHFLVLERLSPRWAWVNDPGQGRYRLARAEFEASFSQFAMEFRLAPDFIRAGRAARPLLAMAARLKDFLPALGFIVVAGLALGLTGLFTLAFTQIFIDQILVRHLTGWVAPLLAAMGLTLLLRLALGGLSQCYLLRLKTRLMAGLAVEMVNRLLRLPMRFFAQRQPGEISHRLSALNGLGNALSVQVIGLATSLLSSMVYGAALLLYDWQMVLLAFALTALNLAAALFSVRWYGDAICPVMLRLGKLAGAAIGSLQVIETIKSMGLETGLLQRLTGIHAHWIAHMHQMELRRTVIEFIPQAIMELGAVLVLGVGIERVMQGRLALGELVVFQALLGQVNAAMVRFMIAITDFQTVRGEVMRIDDILRHPLEALPKQRAGAPSRLAGHIEFREVTFGYDTKTPPLIENISFTLPPGGQLAITGATGSGKSTIARLLGGLYAPWSGSILIDGLPLDRLPPALLHSQLSAVDQQIFLFEGSIRDNLTLWNSARSDADLERAARDAAVYDVIQARPGRFNAPVAEAGANFSGGQAQRLDIARALAGDPAILILDEATAALDPLTEQLILANLKRRGLTRMLVAHRLSAIRDSDCILWLDRGRVLEQGTHDDLMRIHGDYADLARAE